MSSRDRDTGFNFLFMRVYERDKGFILFCFVYFSIVGYVDPTGDNYRVMTFTQKNSQVGSQARNHPSDEHAWSCVSCRPLIGFTPRRSSDDFDRRVSKDPCFRLRRIHRIEPWSKNL